MKKGFTLAEVLITLGIIGIVAAITLPTLIKNYQQQQMLNQLKKVYSVLGQAISRSEADNGFVGEWNYNLSNTEFAKLYILPYIKISKDCGVNENSNCKIQGTWLNGLNINFPSGMYNFITTDGSKCNLNIEKESCLSTMTNKIYITCDINGNRGPNISGKDIFHFNLYQGVNKLSFEGASCRGNINATTVDSNMNFSTHGCKKNATERAGIVCGYAIFKNGWRIPKNYPW